MTDLMDVFGPIAKWNETLHEIHKIGIDVMGTAIDRQGRMHRDVIDLVYHLNSACLDVAVSFISTEPNRALLALMEAGVRQSALKNGVVLKKEFYDQAAQEGEKILSVDDEATHAERASIHINPKNEDVKAYLHKHGYRRRPRQP